jgi:hypothetical protein
LACWPAVPTTGGKRGAAKRLTAELAEGESGDRAAGSPDALVPAPAEAAEGGGGPLVVAYGEDDGKVFVDGRKLAPLTVDRRTFDAARDRVGSYKNLLVSIRPGEVKDFEAAVREGLADCARRLSGSSTSFSLPAWGSVAKQL